MYLPWTTVLCWPLARYLRKRSWELCVTWFTTEQRCTGRATEQTNCMNESSCRTEWQELNRDIEWWNPPLLLYIAVRLPFLLALHFLNRRTSVSPRISATEPCNVFCHLQITCLGQSFSVGIQRFYDWENVVPKERVVWWWCKAVWIFSMRFFLFLFSIPLTYHLSSALSQFTCTVLVPVILRMVFTWMCMEHANS